MILVGQYDSPFVRRVAVSLRVLGFAYEHDARSVFADFDAMRRINPLGRIPSLILPGGRPFDKGSGEAPEPLSVRRRGSKDGSPGGRGEALGSPGGRGEAFGSPGGETLIDSAAILDWLDQSVGPERALVPPAGSERRRALGLIALATGAIDKVGAAAYERLIRPAAYRWPDWIERCRTQGLGAVAALAEEAWPEDARLDQAQITTACMIRYVGMADPELMPPGRFPTLDALSERCEARPEFQSTYPAEYAVPRSP